MERPSFIRHYSQLQESDGDNHYPGDEELLSLGAPLGKSLGLSRLGIHHELIKPGRRTSWPHAESTEEEFFFVLEGNPQAWINGRLYDLVPGDAVAFPAGTGIAHTVINNTERDVRLLVVGERSKPDNRCYYPLNPSRKPQMGDFWWSDPPDQDFGSHDGKPDELRKRSQSF